MQSKQVRHAKNKTQKYGSAKTDYNKADKRK